MTLVVGVNVISYGAAGAIVSTVTVPLNAGIPPVKGFVAESNTVASVSRVNAPATNVTPPLAPAGTAYVNSTAFATEFVAFATAY